MKLSCSHPQSGSTLAVVITIMAVLMVTVGIAFEYTTNVGRNAQRSEAYQKALAVGDGAIEVLFAEWRQVCRNAVAPPIPRTSDLSGLAVPSPFPNMTPTNFVKRGVGKDPNSDSDYNSAYTISNYKVIAVSAEYAALPALGSTPEPQLGQVTGNVSSISPTTSAVYSYIASADVTLPSSFGNASHRNIVAHVRRVFSKQQLSPWNWAIFYLDPLEIHPGPQFTVTGWVHTNSDLFTGHNTLTFADKVTYSGDWYYPTQQHPTYGFMPGDGQHPETPSAPNWPSNLPPARDQDQQPFGFDSTSFDTTDANADNDSYHELIEKRTGPVANDPLAGQRYYDQADFRITVDASDNVSITARTGPTTEKVINAASSGQDKKNYDELVAAITTGGQIQDNREGASMRVTTIDVGSIVASLAGNKLKSWNQKVIYVSASSPAGTKPAIKVVNGSVLPPGGLTIASNNPVYVQGDYNTGGTGAAVPSNDPANANPDGTYIDQSNPPAPYVSGYTPAPSSIVADAVNVLSNNWLDTNSGASPRPTAAPTTVNSAIVSGIVPTNVYGDNAYSGGAENFPRFLENWNKKTFTYYGSMIELYKSEQSISEWGKPNVYSPPTRQWYFDSNFKTNPPPGTIMIYNYVKGRWSVF